VTKVVTMEANASAYTSYHPLSTNTPAVAAATIASSAVMVRYGARDATFATTDTAYELTGLMGHYDDGTLIATHEGIVVASDPEWKANLLANSSVNRELSIDLLLAALDVQLARSGVPVKTMMMGLGQRRKYFNLLASDIRYGTANFVGGYESLKFSQNGAVEMLVDPSCQPNKIFMEGENIIKKYELSPIGWGGFDANKMHWRQDYDEAAMYLKLYTNLGVENRRALTLVDDLTEPGNAPF
jgi:hypothetical protein